MSQAPLWTSQAAARALGLQPVGSWAAESVEIDSRQVRAGALFVAIVGDRLDGHDYVAAAFAAGAVAAVVHRTPKDVAADDPRLLTVADSLRGLEALAIAARKRTAAQVVAVTGSVGKTGTKEMLRLALGGLGACHASMGNLNNHWGAPLSLARMPQDVGFAAIELGMNHAGELRPLTRMVRPDVAVVTRIAPAHTAFFDSIEAVADAKAEIFEGLSDDGVAVLNADDSLTERLAAKAAPRRILRFGEAAGADIRLTGLELAEAGSTVAADVLGQPVRWRLGAAGRHWAMNSLAVMGAVAALGGDLDAAAAALAATKAPAGRGERRTAGRIDLIDESYNASPAAVRAAFAALALARPAPGGRRVVVLGDMLELGERTDADHAGLGEAFIQAKLDRAHGAGRATRHFMQALPDAACGIWEPDAAALAARAGEMVAAGDVVLVKGSLGMGMAQVVQALEGAGRAL